MSSLSVFPARKHVAHFTPPRGCLEHFLCRYSSVDLPVLVVTIDWVYSIFVSASALMHFIERYERFRSHDRWTRSQFCEGGRVSLHGRQINDIKQPSFRRFRSRRNIQLKHSDKCFISSLGWEYGRFGHTVDYRCSFWPNFLLNHLLLRASDTGSYLRASKSSIHIANHHFLRWPAIIYHLSSRNGKLKHAKQHSSSGRTFTSWFIQYFAYESVFESQINNLEYFQSTKTKGRTRSRFLHICFRR